MGEKSKSTRPLDQRLPYNRALTLPLYRAFFEDNEDLELGLSTAGIIVLIQKTAGTTESWCLDQSESVLIIPIGDSLVQGLKIYSNQLQGLNHWKQCLTLTLKIDGSNLSRLALDLGTTGAVTKLLEELLHTHPTKVFNDKPNQLISRWVKSKKGNEERVGNPCTRCAEKADTVPASTTSPIKPVSKEDKRLMKFLITPASNCHEINSRVGYHVAYCNFITRNSGLDRPALREKITHTLNWPKFLMEHFSTFPCPGFPEMSHKLLSALVMQAVSSRKCAWKDCNEFSLLKCKACKSSYYCNENCQLLDAEHHKTTCIARSTIQTTGAQGSSIQYQGNYHGKSLGIQLRRGLADLGCVSRGTLTLKEFKHTMGLRMLERGVKYFASRGILEDIAIQAGFKFQLTTPQVKRLIANHSRSLSADKFEKQLLSAEYAVPTRATGGQAPLRLKYTEVGCTQKRPSNEAEFICKPKLLAVLTTVSDTLQQYATDDAILESGTQEKGQPNEATNSARRKEPTLVVFKFTDIVILLRRYLLKNAHRIKMDCNKSRFIFNNDPLGDALGVPVLYTSQIPDCLLAQLIPYTPEAQSNNLTPPAC